MVRSWPVVALVALLSACGGGSDSDDNPPPPPVIAKVTVTQTTPANNAVNVPADIKPTVVFTATDATAITAKASILCSDGVVISSSVSTPAPSGGTLTVTPSRSLPMASTCNLSVTLDALPAGPALPGSGPSSSAGVWIAFTTIPFTPRLYTGVSTLWTLPPAGVPTMVILDLGSGQAQEVAPPGSGCVGAFNPAIVETQLTCVSGTVQADGRNTQFSKHNPATNAFSAGARYAAVQTYGATVDCTNDGRCFYLFSNRGSVPSDSRVGIVNKDQSVKATVAAPDQTRQPFKTRLTGGKLYILSQEYTQASNAYTASLSRFDVATEGFDNFSATAGVIPISQRAYDLVVVGGKILVSVDRGADGKDVIAFDAATGARVVASDIALPSGGKSGLAATDTTLYVGHSTGLRAFDVASGTLKRTASTMQATELLTGNGKVYAAVSGTRTIYELDPELLSTSRTLQWTDGYYQTGPLWMAEAR